MRIHITNKHPRINNAESPKKNGQEWPTVYYGLHMVPGVAEYADGPDGKPYRIFISDETAKLMNPSFEGRPVYVEHVDDEKLNVPNKTVDGETSKDGNKATKAADGYVIESFYNPPDGMHWAKFLVISREGHEAISRGWQLSNCYQPATLGPGGEWHGVEYVKEFTAAEYKHLAIVPNPRYKESKILTPEEFKEYNKNKVDELAAMKNSADKAIPKENGAMKIFNMFFPKKNGVEKIENSEQIGKTLVNMGNGRMVTVSQLIKNAAKMNDEDYEKLMVEKADRPEHNDAEDEVDENPFAKKNRKKSDDEDMDELKDKKNRKRSDEEDLENDDEEDEVPPFVKKNRKRSDEEDPENGEFDGRGTDGEKDFVGNKRNRKRSDAEDMELENDGLGEDPLKHVIMLDGEETSVGDMINAHMDLKNKYQNLRNKHNDLKEEHASLRAKYGDDDDCMNMEIPERDADMQEVLGRLEDEEGNLEESLGRRKNAIEKIIGKMKNSTDAAAKREAKKAEGLENFKRLQNAELSAMLDANSVTVATETSMSMVQRGKSRYGSPAVNS